MSTNYRGLNLGARMVSGLPRNFNKTSFYQPVCDINSNAGGVRNEALNVRLQGRCGIFDLGNMSLINVKGNGTYKSLNKLFTNNIYNCGHNSIIDTLMLNEKGKVIDKPVLSNFNGELSILCRNSSVPIIKTVLDENKKISMENKSVSNDIFAIQGSWSRAAMNKMYYFLNLNFKNIVNDRQCCVKESDVTVLKKSITGADGYIVSIPKHETDTLLDKLLHQPNIYLSGIDALLVNQMESRMLTENEMNGEYTPDELNQLQLVNKSVIGEDFIGKECILDINNRVKSSNKKIQSITFENYNFTKSPKVIKSTDREEIGKLRNVVYSPYLQQFKGVCEMTSPDAKIGILDNKQVELMNIF